MLCASAMNAPAALLFAKILIPETKDVDQEFKVNRQEIGRNPIDALANRTHKGLISLNVAAMLISFYAVILLINYFLSYIGSISITGVGSVNDWIFSLTEERFEKLSSSHFRFSFCTICMVNRHFFLRNS